MKKTYVKPEVMLVRFELSEAIASCGTKLYNYAELSCERNPLFEEYTLTGDSASCTEAPLYGYCYTTSTELLMNS